LNLSIFRSASEHVVTRVLWLYGIHMLFSNTSHLLGYCLLPGASLRETPQLIVEPFSERGLEVLRLIADGNANQRVADALIAPTGTVEKHLDNVFGELGVQSRTQRVARACEWKLLIQEHCATSG
jgi:ATP/maltotriose-dependent transcriptional regulator MalT